MMRSDLLALAERVEAATASDLRLDTAIAEAMELIPEDAKRRDYDDGSYRWVIDELIAWWPPAFTSDPAASLRLIEQRWPEATMRIMLGNKTADIQAGGQSVSGYYAFARAAGDNRAGRLARALTSVALRLQSTRQRHA